MIDRARRVWMEGIVKAHERHLIAWARRWAGAHATDLVQEALLRLWRSDLATGSIATAWLYRVVRNLAVDEARRVRVIGQPMADFGTLNHVVPEDRMALAEGARRVLERLATLPPRQQEVVRLRLVDELSYQEIGEVLGLTATNVGFILHAALSTLRSEAQDIVPDFVRRGA